MPQHLLFSDKKSRAIVSISSRMELPHNIRKEKSTMLYSDYTGELLGLKDVLVTGVVNKEDILIIYLDSKLQMQVCPACGWETKRVHSYRTQAVKDLPMQGKRTILYLRKRRYYCPGFYPAIPLPSCQTKPYLKYQLHLHICSLSVMVSILPESGFP